MDELFVLAAYVLGPVIFVGGIIGIVQAVRRSRERDRVRRQQEDATLAAQRNFHHVSPLILGRHPSTVASRTPAPSAAPTPERSSGRVDPLTSGLIGYALGGGFSHHESESPAPSPSFESGGGNFGGGGASSDWGSSSDSSSSSSSDCSSGSSGC